MNPLTAARRVAARASLVLLLVGCQEPANERPSPPRSSTASPDRLLPSEELPGRPRVFGIEVPPGLKVSARFAERAQLTGHAELTGVVKALQKQLVTGAVELAPRRALFTSATVRSDPKKRVYRVEMVQERNLTTVQILDITPPPVMQGLSEAERWERAGMNPDGSVKDRLKVY